MLPNEMRTRLGGGVSELFVFEPLQCMSNQSLIHQFLRSTAAVVPPFDTSLILFPCNSPREQKRLEQRNSAEVVLLLFS